MPDIQPFRCPFEVKGIEDGTIIVVQLAGDQAVRFTQLRAAFEQFHRDPKQVAIRLILPHSVGKGCTSNEELEPRLLQYQAEVIAADLDDKLFPYLPYQDGARKQFEQLGLRLPFDEYPAKQLRRLFGRKQPRSIAELAAWILPVFQSRAGLIEVKSRWRQKTVISFDPSASVVLGEEPKTTFGIVKTPFYPEAFGRYSCDVEIVLNRELDVERLSAEVRRRIRRRANDVHVAHGVRIPDPNETQQPTGLWIPRYR